MLVLVLYAAIFIAGLVALITGKISVSKRKSVQGTPARLIGALLCAAVPISFVVTVVVALVMGGASPQNETVIGLTPIGCLIGVALLAAVLISQWARPNPLKPGEKSFVFSPPGEVRSGFVPPQPPQE